MAALRRIIASRQHPTPSPLPLPNARPPAEDSHTSLDGHNPTGSGAQVAASDHQVGSPQVRPALAQSVQQAAGTSSEASLTGHAADSGMATSNGDKSVSVEPSGSACAQAQPCNGATGTEPAASCANQWQVCHCFLLLIVSFRVTG